MAVAKTKNPNHSIFAGVMFTGKDREARGAFQWLASDDAMARALDTPEMRDVASTVEDSVRYVIAFYIL